MMSQERKDALVALRILRKGATFGGAQLTHAQAAKLASMIKKEIER